MVEPKPLLQVAMPSPRMASLPQDMGNLIMAVPSLHQLGRLMELLHLATHHLVVHPSQATVSRCLMEMHHLLQQAKLLEDMDSHHNHLMVMHLLVVTCSLHLILVPTIQLVVVTLSLLLSPLLTVLLLV